MYVQRKYSQILLPRQVKMIIVFIFAYLPMYPSFSYAYENNGRGVKAIGMANAFTAVSDNCWAIDYNPAGLMQIDYFQCSAFIVPQQFGMKELATAAIAGAVPLRFATAGFKIERFGFDLYNETEFGIALAAKIDGNVSFGIALDNNHLEISRYGSSDNVTVCAGCIVRVVDNISIGFSTHNITGKSIGRNLEKLPQLCALGTSWSPLKELTLSLEIEKDIRFPASIKAGIEQTWLNAFAVRAGFANNPDKYSAGIAVKYSVFEFGYAGYSHPDLGWTHQVELSIELYH
jgi:hypothetical protein